VQLFHYHVVTSRVREQELRYERELGFGLVARYGTIGGEQITAAAERGWGELERAGFRHRLTELERDGVNVVVQPGRGDVPLVDHVGVLTDSDGLQEVLGRAAAAGLRVQERAGRRTFVATGAGYRLELRTDLAGPVAPFDLALAADEPLGKAAALAGLLGLTADGPTLVLGTGALRFAPGGPPGRPRLTAEFLRPR
jgi:hypothetical protein